MNKSILHCAVISPMFSYGNQKLELRPTELKGIMRYIYRIANHSVDTKLLYKVESKYFGDAEEHASPVRLQMKVAGIKLGLQPLLLHKPIDDKNKKKPHFEIGTTFDVVIRTLFRANKDVDEKPHEWYKELVLLSIVLGGLGKRTRRGRGCVTTTELTQKNNQQLLMWVTDHLNEINDNKFLYEIKNGVIVAVADLSRFKRPVIEKIEIGKEIKDINAFLESVDEAAHTIKCTWHKRMPDDKFATGFVVPKRDSNGSGRFSSSVIVSVTQTSDGIFPIYTYVKAIYNSSPLDIDCQERDEFISLIKGGLH
ncbi:type III-B CRISPR module RAMP protein Cmr1 [Desulfosporosinus shakirovi]|uniref:type III-B CRISPR module RAMP protein Cmr1 n=1 Tax=Desulfosporosinus shakirovi TaxID=2885154 RepID=UPI001E421894|nr:type III-B CRISPR module RAMP protein Cmr1 [Desulfosporosinus sp. SRJS8]MCB8818365.1 type III-B CRISPR module RAMP protein Cmr1 [Desulfosporosinus sp. SRJS8]